MHSRDEQSELTTALRGAAAKLQRFASAVIDLERVDLTDLAPEIHHCDRVIREIVARRSATLSRDEREAYLEWRHAASTFRRAAHRRLEEMDDSLRSIRQCSRAIRGFGILRSHHRGQTIEQKL